MTYTLPRYQSYQEYLNDDQLSNEQNYRLLSTGEIIEVPLENDINRLIACVLIGEILKTEGIGFIRYLCRGDKDLQVMPIGDKWVNRKPDLMVMRPEHLTIATQAILLEMPAPLFVAEVVSPGSESSDNYLRDYVWKRQQYEWWQIPEYWIIDPHRDQVSVLTLVKGTYQAVMYRGQDTMDSSTFPTLSLSAEALLSGQIED